MDFNGGITSGELIWALGSLCALHRIPFDAALLVKQFPPPYTFETLVHAARALRFNVRGKTCGPDAIRRTPLPCLAVIRSAAPRSGDAGDGTGALHESEAAACTETAPMAQDGSSESRDATMLALISEANAERVVVFEAGSNTPKILSPAQFADLFAGKVFLLKPAPRAVKDPDGAVPGKETFGFRWFVPELLKHKPVWRSVLLASLVIQLLALGTPLFTQVVIDKVVVHRTESTLIVIAIGLAVFMIFSALLTWVRQYLVLHTGNRVDAVLGSAVFEHLFKLPPLYFEHRPTGVIAARLHGVETIREFVASAAVTLVLDLPFLVIFVAIMFYYSASLTLIAAAILAVIIGMSLAMAPLFQARLNRQFLMGAPTRPSSPSMSPGWRP